MSVKDYPKCMECKRNCFANTNDNRCKILTNTKFKDDKQCPFYKDKNDKSIQHLLKD